MTTELKDKIKIDGTHVYLYADIEAESALLVNQNLKEAANTALLNVQKYEAPAKVYLHINSLGGSIFDMFSIADTVIQSVVPVTTIIEGIAASAASFIAVHGAERYITPNSHIMLHQISSVLWWENVASFEIRTKALKRWQKQMVKRYAQYTVLTKKKINKKLKHNWWINAEEALELGFVDRVL